MQSEKRIKVPFTESKRNDFYTKVGETKTYMKKLGIFGKHIECFPFLNDLFIYSLQKKLKNYVNLFGFFQGGGLKFRLT